MKMNQWYGSDMPAGTSLTLLLVNAVNPATITSPVTSSIKIYTYNTIDSTEVLVDSVSSSVQITPALVVPSSGGGGGGGTTPSSSTVSTNNAYFCSDGYYWTGTSCA